MSKTVIVAVYDTVANLYGSPFVSINTNVAVREFIAEQRRDNHQGPMQTNPQDFKLFQLGTYDPQQGRIELLEQPQFLYVGIPHEAQQ